MFQEIRDYQKHLHQALRQRRKDFYERINYRNGRKTGNAPKTSSRETIDNLLLKGLLAHNEGDYEESVSIYSRILELEIKRDIKTIILTHRGMALFCRRQVTRSRI